nr:hypothetical protein [uncultured Sphingobacterium sp.]
MMNIIRKKHDLFNEKRERIGYTILNYTLIQIEEQEDFSYENNPDADRQNKYLLDISQRIIYFNKNSIDVNPVKDQKSFLNYPVSLIAQINLMVDNIDISIIDYDPKVINNQINKNESESDAKGNINSSTVSSTRSNSISNSINVGVSATAGIMDSNVSSHMDFTHTETNDFSRTKGSETSNSVNKEHVVGASMAIEDWGSYANINTLAETQKGVTWNFGQQYPWNALLYKKYEKELEDGSNTVKINLPSYVKNRLYDNGTILPPSAISLYGFDFTMSCSFLITTSDFLNDLVRIEHNYKILKASHLKDTENENIMVTTDKNFSFLTFEEGTLTKEHQISLNLLSLDPICLSNNAAIIGFFKKSFELMPSEKNGFRIKSYENDLLIQSESLIFEKEESPYSIANNNLMVTLGKGDSAVFNLYFKVTDRAKNYNLNLKHWLSDDSTEHLKGIDITFKINDDDECLLSKNLKDIFREGGENNVMTISLRNINFSSIHFHEYLKVGLNRIQITLTNTNEVTMKYILNALSIEVY